MAYIYKITNDINGKSYVGKTEKTIEKRWKEHCQDYQRQRCENRPLYKAINKYGIEHFHIEQLEETNNPEEREIYWIERLGTFKYGYNATIGGDGKKYLDYDVIISTYKELQNIQQTASLLGISRDTVSRVVKESGEDIKSSDEIIREKSGKIVKMFDANTQELLQVFSTVGDAARYLRESGYTKAKDIYGISAHIGKCANGIRNKAYGFIWKW